MGTAHPQAAPAEDLTARARIRNAAIAAFASRGFRRANVRDIAADAGVSAALVIHHFGSKAGLREVCDEHVLEVVLRRARNGSQLESVRIGIRDYLGNTTEFHEQVHYMARAIDEDSPSSDRFVEALVAESEDWLKAGIADGTVRATSDLRGMSVLTMLISLSLLTMPSAIARALGEESLNLAVMRRMAMPSIELYTHGVYTDDLMLTTIRDALDEPEGAAPAAPTTTTTTEEGTR